MKAFNEMTDTEIFSYRLMVEQMIQKGQTEKDIENILETDKDTIKSLLDTQKTKVKVIKATELIKKKKEKTNKKQG